jgi:hypothetical protein
MERRTGGMGEVLSELNRNIVGLIEIIAAFGVVGEATVDADEQSGGIEERRP